MPAKVNHLVISALGEDRPGIVNQLSKAIYELDCNITDSRMTVLGGEFAILLLVEGPWNLLAKLEDQVPELQDRLQLTITTRRTGERVSQANLLPYGVDVVALDHPGIVYSLASFFSDKNINIEDMTTSSYAAAHTGTPMFSVRMSIGIPADIHIAGLRDEFMDFCDSMNLDAVLEPIKG
jgi:glycine cleavage system transcriptional repressor